MKTVVDIFVVFLLAIALAIMFLMFRDVKRIIAEQSALNSKLDSVVSVLQEWELDENTTE